MNEDKQVKDDKTNFFILKVWSPKPSWSSILSASSNTNTLILLTSITFFLIRFVIVPGVPTIICAETVLTSGERWSLIAYSVWTEVYLPILTMTVMIWRASSREGARHKAFSKMIIEMTKVRGRDDVLEACSICSPHDSTLSTRTPQFSLYQIGIVQSYWLVYREYRE